MSMYLREATQHDKTCLTEIITKSFNYDTQCYFGPEAEDGPPGYNDGTLVERLLEREDNQTYVIEVHDRAVGMVSVNLWARSLDYLCLLPAFIGKGYGKKAWYLITERFGVEDWVVETPDYSTGNHMFYQKLGFSKTGKVSYGREAKAFIFKKEDMNRLTRERVGQLVKGNHAFMTLLRIVSDLNLLDCWVAAGTVRHYLWNVLGSEEQLDEDTDVDVVFFDPKADDKIVVDLERQLNEEYPMYQWEIKNQVNMHRHNPHASPYQNTREAILHYPERCTAIGVRLNNGEIEVYAPYGFGDIEAFRVRPTHYVLEDEEKLRVYQRRMSCKTWREKYPQLNIDEAYL